MKMVNFRGSRSKAGLEDLWQQYRQACGEPDAGVNFMPHLWHKIEARRSRFHAFERAARYFAAAAASLALVLGGVVVFEGAQQTRSFHAETYVEVLSAESAHASAFYVEPATYEFEPASARQDRP